MKKVFSAAFAALVISACTAFAAPVSVTFTNNGPLPYAESGFLFQGKPGDTVTDSVLNPIPFDVADTIEITRSGEAFRFASFEIYRHNSLHSAFDLLGFLDGIEVVDYGNFALGGGEIFQTIYSGADTLIDELRMVGTDLRGSALAINTFSFDVDRGPMPVPVPAALPLLAGGLGILGFAGWRRRNGGSKSM